MKDNSIKKLIQAEDRDDWIRFWEGFVLAIEIVAVIWIAIIVIIAGVK